MTYNELPLRYFKVVFRSSSVVDEKVIAAKNMKKAAKIASKITMDPDEAFYGWSFYSLTAL